MKTKNRLEGIADLLLEIASILMVSGANTNRVNVNIDRFASVLDCESYSLISQKTIILTVIDNETKENYTKVKNLPGHKIDFTIISSISKASWKAIEEDWTLSQIKQEINTVIEQKRYSNYIVLIAVSFSGAGFCKIFGGDYLNLALAFISTFAGLFMLQSAHKRHFNSYISVFLASLTASLLASIGVYFNLGTQPDATLATSVLFLVPGVALINSFTDFIDKNVLNGMVRFANGLMTVLAIALGLFVAMLIFQLK
ncbi:threonine/serine exporter family protein [Winogradskyella litoriviva]|uniref:Threonine/serine exporter family protein n=1 Tax=Winogradskyella litoriviva TaxID=1220182 RepID=A0ABX2E1P3_9FLAO|nr:threonine/serine exporter family protein [Winogradskyella litoriviva]NRD22210.1 threonine/serine exporter family protein [Winogradskyella litoriviva]